MITLTYITKLPKKKKKQKKRKKKRGKEGEKKTPNGSEFKKKKGFITESPT
jgi:hypothetical protein